MKTSLICGLILCAAAAVGMVAMWAVFVFLNSHPLPTVLIGGVFVLVSVVRSANKRAQKIDLEP